MWWGVSMEMALKFPFSHAYFPEKHHELLAILTGPISCECFMDLVHYIGTATTPSSKYTSTRTFGVSHGIFAQGATTNVIDGNITWSAQYIYNSNLSRSALCLYVA